MCAREFSSYLIIGLFLYSSKAASVETRAVIVPMGSSGITKTGTCIQHQLFPSSVSSISSPESTQAFIKYSFTGTPLVSQLKVTDVESPAGKLHTLFVSISLRARA